MRGCFAGLERPWIDLAEQHLERAVPAELIALDMRARGEGHAAPVRPPDGKHVRRHRADVVDGTETAGFVIDAIEHRPGGNADDRKARSLGLDHRDTKRLVRHRGNIDVGAGKPARQLCSVGEIARRNDPLIAGSDKRIADRPVADQRQSRTQLPRKLCEGIDDDLRPAFAIEPADVDQERLDNADAERLPQFRIHVFGREV